MSKAKIGGTLYVATSHVFEHIFQGRPNISFLYLYHLSHTQAVLDGSGGNRPGQVGFIWNIWSHHPG